MSLCRQSAEFLFRSLAFTPMALETFGQVKPRTPPAPLDRFSAVDFECHLRFVRSGLSAHVPNSFLLNFVKHGVVMHLGQ